MENLAGSPGTDPSGSVPGDPAKLTSVSRLVELEVHGPDRVGADRTHGPDVDAESVKRLLALAIGNFQAL